jgi:hypothetical protein
MGRDRRVSLQNLEGRTVRKEVSERREFGSVLAMGFRATSCQKRTLVTTGRYYFLATCTPADVTWNFIEHSPRKSSSFLQSISSCHRHLSSPGLLYHEYDAFFFVIRSIDYKSPVYTPTKVRGPCHSRKVAISTHYVSITLHKSLEPTSSV